MNSDPENFDFKQINLTWLKENLPVIVIIPALLGGLWQLIELSLIGLPYIRFFSVSQLISDGLLLLFMFSTVGAAILGLREEYKKSGSGNGLLPRTSLVLVGVITITILLVIIFFGSIYKEWKVYQLLEEYGLANWEDVKRRILFGGIVILLIFAGWRLVSGRFLFHFFKNRIWYFPVYFISLITVFVLLSRILFELPENLKNHEYIRCRISNHGSNIISHKINYFNDKYIFVRVVDSVAQQRRQYVCVLKFDDLFDASACDTLPK